jgi:hypothetical protein
MPFSCFQQEQKKNKASKQTMKENTTCLEEVISVFKKLSYALVFYSI